MLNWESGGTAAPREPAARSAGRAGPPPASYVVRSGDTLYGIAWRYGLDHRAVARWNRLGSGTFITPGQRLRLTPPPAQGAAATKAPASPPTQQAALRAPPRWQWPAGGPVIEEFGAEPGPRTGLLVGGALNDPVRAAAAGRVVYAGSGLIGYGKLIIVKHNDSYLSAYGHNQRLLVSEGDDIALGQTIAQMGEGPGRRPSLHFEIRRNGTPENPRRYLPAR